MLRTLLSLACVGVIAGAALSAETVKSGLQAGDKVTAFNPLNVTGSSAGEKSCQV
jgi:hypothetical protein